MRVLLLGSPNHDKIAQALRKEHYLYDFMANPEKEAAGIPEGVYDAAILLADRTDNQFAVQLSRTLCVLREGGAALPVLVVASHLSARDRVLALDAGADDVLTAPFLMGELLARVRALSRRGPALQPRQLCAGDLTLDRGHCMLRSRGGEIRLSGKEMQIVELFLLHPGQVLPRATLQHKVWGMDNEFAYNNIEVYLSLVRRKLRAIGSAVQIHAERGVGYYLEA
nr:response regulator transcription factor [uncultured Agathobaculum sp.]